MQPTSSHLHDDDSASGSEQLIVPRGTYQHLLTSALGFVQNVYQSATRPPTPSLGMVSGGDSPTFPGAYPFEPYQLTNARPSSPTPKLSIEHLSVPGDAFLRQPSPPPISNTIPPDPTHRPPSASPTPAAPAPVSFLEGAVNTTFNNPIINNIGRDATIFKFDGDGPLHADLKGLFVDHLTGLSATTDLFDKLEKHNLSQSICNLPRANAAYNDYAAKDKKHVTCFENTRQTLRKEIGEWITTVLDKPEIYVLSGLAGIGKSTVAQTVAERADNLHFLGASFFFSRDEADLRNAKRFYTTIAFQLCVYDKHFAQAIGKVLLEEKGAAATSKEPMAQLNALIVEPLRHLLNLRSRPLVIVVDALDECDVEDGLIVLQTLKHLVHELPSLRVVLTSRPQPLFDRFFDKHRVFYMHDIEDKVVENDIRLYLKYRLSWEQVNSHLNLRTCWGANEEEIECLVRAAGRLFIIASTAVLFILDKAARNPASQMKKLQTALSQDLTPFNALNEFYTVILRSAVPADCDHGIVERYQAVIGTIVVVQDPLPIATLANLIGLSSEDVCAVLDNLQPVILLGDNDIPRVYHKSFTDYIRDMARCKDDNLWIVPKDQHTRITICCFNVMNTRLKRNILGLGTQAAQYMSNSDGLRAEGVSDDRLREKFSPELRYACVYWANHFEGANIEDIDLIKEVDGFATERLLYWFEALSWICKLDLAHRALLTVHKLLKLTPSDTREILFDAFRFISKNYDVIERSALHVYHSALPFTPTKIPLSNVYKKDDLRQLGCGPERWDALVAITKHENSIYRITFSLDSFHLASWAGQEMKLWDATSGTPVKSFKADRVALARDFSMVTFSQDHTLTLYDVMSNAPVANYDIPSAKVIELALSSDGSRLAVGLSDGTVSLWDSRGIGGSIASLGGYACENGRLEFSPSGYHLAFCSDNGGIRLWNGLNGEFIASLSYKSEKLLNFVFSRSGSRLAAQTTTELGFGLDLTLWNGENGKFISVAMDVGGCLAISDDGSLIATGGDRFTVVQLWSGNSLSLIDDVKIGQRWIRCLAFSLDTLAIGSYKNVTLYDLKTRAIITSVELSQGPDFVAISPTRLAIGFDHEEHLHLWDVQNMKASTSTSMKKPRIVTVLAFSPNCSRLASGFKDGSVELWDTGSTEQVIANLTLHSWAITALAFSTDGEQLASGSLDGSVMLWGGGDGATSGGILDRIFQHPLTSITFSSHLLAAATWDRIALFDHKTLRHIHSLEEGGYHISFSSDGSLLAYTNRSSPLIPLERLDVILLDVKARRRIARFNSNSSDIQRLVFSPDHSWLAALTPDGLEFFDITNKCTANPRHEEISWIFQNGTLISQPPRHFPMSRAYGRPLLGHFPGHCGQVPILWMPTDVGISALTVESSTFALGCTDGRLMIGHIPLP